MSRLTTERKDISEARYVELAKLGEEECVMICWWFDVSGVAAA